jgi:hypothetical protein
MSMKEEQMTIAELTALARDAYPINDDEWGSERQIKAQNLFFISCGELPEEFDTMKASGRQLIDQGLAYMITHKWFNRIGTGFHPDTRGNDYSPALPDAADYDADMRVLFSLDVDPYAWGAWLMERNAERLKN